MLKKLISILCITAIYFQLTLLNVSALESNQKFIFTSNTIKVDYGIQKALTSQYNLTSGIKALSLKSSNNSIDTPDKLKIEIYKALNARLTSFTINYVGDTSNISELITSLINDIFNNDDYLHYSISQYQYTGSGYSNDVTLEFSFVYFGEPDEAYVNSTCQNIIDSIILPEDSVQKKIEKVHDYLVRYLKYDESLTYYDAVSALKYKTAVCQGYSLLMQKMMNLMGIESEIIVGEADGANHSWNLVLVDGYWYHIDATWDDPIPDQQGRALRTYFMVSNEFMRAHSHIWDENKYPKTGIYSIPSRIITATPTPTPTPTSAPTATPTAAPTATLIGFPTAKPILTPTPTKSLSKTKPKVPTGIIVTVNKNKLNLSWNTVTGAKSYKVYFKKQHGSYTVLFTKSPKLQILKLRKSTKYYFKVSAINSAGEGKASTEISKTTGK
jgi:hypothetical protein